MVSNTTVWIIYDRMTCIYVEGTVSFVLRDTEFYGEYSTKNDANTTVYHTVSTRVTNHPSILELDSVLSIVAFAFLVKD